MPDQLVFFSYSRTDASDFALKLASDLRNANLNIWIDQLDIHPGQRWDFEIQKSLKASTSVIFIISEASVSSDNVLDEVNYALNNKKRVFPIIMMNCEIPYRISRLQHIDFTKNFDLGLKMLLSSLVVEKKADTEKVVPIKITEEKITQEEETKNIRPLNDHQETIQWQRAISNPSIDGLKNYLDRYPSGKFTDLALLELARLQEIKANNVKEENLWLNTKKENTISSYTHYLNVTTIDEYKSQAVRLLSKLEKQEERQKIGATQSIEKSTRPYKMLLKVGLPAICVLALVWYMVSHSSSKDVIVSKKSKDSSTLSNKVTYSFDREKLAQATLKYNKVGHFQSGFAPVENDEKNGVIDSTGKEVVPLIYERPITIPTDFNEGGLALVNKGFEHWGFIDKSGKEVIPLKYTHGYYNFDDGLVAIELDNRYGFIDKTEQTVIPFIYNLAHNFHEGLACALKMDGHWGFIDKTGKEIIPFVYDGANDFSEGLALVKKYSKSRYIYGFIDKNGNEVIPPQFASAYQFHEGLALVEKDGKYGFIDKSGNTVIQFLYSDGKHFYDGFATVNKGNKYGFVNKEGKEIIPFKYDSIYRFRDGLARVKDANKWGLLDTTGKEVIQTQYDYITNIGYGIIIVTAGAKKIIYIDGVVKLEG